MEKWAQPTRLSDADVLFPGKVSHLMPAYTDIADDFKGWHSPWNRFASHWFFLGMADAKFTPKPGVAMADALRHLRSIISSFEPSHEHKEAAVGYLASLWFERIEYTARGEKFVLPALAKAGGAA